MNVKEWNLGDLSSYSPYREAPKPGRYDAADFVILKVDAPTWLFFKVFTALQQSGVGAIGVPAPGGAMVAWSRVKDCEVYDFIMDAELQELLLTTKDADPQIAEENARDESDGAEKNVEVAPVESGDVKSVAEVADGEEDRESTTDPNSSDGLVADVAIHSWVSSEKTFKYCVESINAPVHYFLETPSSKPIPEERRLLFPSCKIEEISLKETFAVEELVDELYREFDKRKFLKKSRVVFDLTGASKYLWKAMEITAPKRFERFSFVVFDVQNNRRQISADGNIWRLESPDPPETSSGSTSCEDEPPEQQPRENEVAEEVEKTTVPDESDSLFAEEDRLKEITLNIRQRLDLTRRMWLYCELIDTPAAWSFDQSGMHGVVDPPSRHETSGASRTFLDAACELNHERVLIEDSAHSRRIFFTLNPCPSIYFYVKKDRDYAYDLQLSLKGWGKTEIQRYFGGGWFKEGVFLQLEGQMGEDRKPLYRLNVDVQTPGGKLDVVAQTKNGKILVLECKTNSNATVADVEALENKVRALTCGNEPSNNVVGILLCPRRCSSDDLFRARVNNSRYVACVCGDSTLKLIEDSRFQFMRAGMCFIGRPLDDGYQNGLSDILPKNKTSNV